MNTLVEDANSRRRKVTGRSTVIFLTVMLLLTFFSKTINNFTLPKVTYETPASGALIKDVSGTGNVEAKTIHDLYVHSSMTVTGVMVQVGDSVKQGQPMLTLDTTDVENLLKDERDRYAQKNIYLEKLVAVGEKLKEASSPENLLNLDKAVQTARQNVDKAQRNYESSKILYEAGGISANDLTDAQMNLENARMDYEIAKNNREKTLRDNNRDIENNQRDIDSTKLDIDMAKRRIAQLTKELNMGTVTAPIDGIVTELYYSVGMRTNTSQPLYKIADTAEGFQFIATVTVSAAEYLGPGDAAEISISSLNRITQGVVTQIKDNQQQIGVKKDVIIDIPPEGLIGGEIGTANIRKNMGSYNALVSNSAVGQDSSGGYFVYVLKESKGPLGNEFYVERVSVSIGDSDNLKTAVLSGVNARDKVVTNSDKPISDGSRVMLAD